MKDDITDTRLCELIRREAARLGQARREAGFKNVEVADAALVEAMSIARGTAKQVRARLLSLVNETLHGLTGDPPQGASPDEIAAYGEALEAYIAAMQAETAKLEWVQREAKRRGAGPTTPYRDVFTKEELAKLPRYLMRPVAK
jgi:hypothetical protein